MSVCVYSVFVLFCVGSGLTWGKKPETNRMNHDKAYMYRVSQEEKPVFCEVIISAILSKNLYMYMCPIRNGFRDRAISLYTVQTSNTPCPHTSCKVH
jgi:hypothetical protein